MQMSMAQFDLVSVRVPAGAAGAGLLLGLMIDLGGNLLLRRP